MASIDNRCDAAAAPFFPASVVPRVAPLRTITCSAGDSREASTINIQVQVILAEAHPGASRC